MESISDSTGIRGSVESLIGGREENQDSYGMAETRHGMLIVVCDGMGGGPGGKTASTIAVQSIIDYVSGAEPDSNPLSVLEDAAMAANENVRQAVEQNPALQGMGTTCVCVLISKDEAYIMHVGDSRCYQLRKDKAVFRTVDHSYVSELVRRGSLTEEEARTSQYSNVITRAIGASVDVKAEVEAVKIQPGDRFALMTDGIWGTMPEPQLVGLLGYDDDPASLVPQIAARIDADGVNAGKRHDNLTLALVDIPGKKRATQSVAEPSRAPAKTRNILAWCLGVALVCALGVICWLLFLQSDDVKENSSKEARTQEATEVVKKETPEPYDNSHNAEVYQNVIKTLESVKNYKPSADDKSSQKEVERKRLAMIEEAAETLRQLSITVAAPSLKERIQTVAAGIIEKGAVMKRVDGKWKHSRQDSNEEIDRNIEAVKALMEMK